MVQSQIVVADAEITKTMEGALPDIFGMLASINFVAIIGAFLFYFLFGYFLYAALFAAVASAVENEADTQQLTIPITIPLIIGIFLMMHTFRYPDSSLSFWGSMIPFTSPMVMMARIPFGVPFWQILLSLSLLFLTFLVAAWFAGKIYRVGILMYGKKPTLREIWKWTKIKN
jgi:ABC-2 type transport system permease protein